MADRTRVAQLLCELNDIYQKAIKEQYSTTTLNAKAEGAVVEAFNLWVQAGVGQAADTVHSIIEDFGTGHTAEEQSDTAEAILDAVAENLIQ